MDIILKDFEGPLDLLLHLVSKYKMDIYDVPIVEVIEQYLSYINTLQAMRLEVAGEYMLMASQLMLIKSRKLLPKIVETVIEEDPEMELLSQIEEYSRFKEVSDRIAQQHEGRSKLFVKEKQEIIAEEVQLVCDKTTMDLFLVFSQMISRRQHQLNTSQAVIEKDEFKIEDMMLVIKSIMVEKKTAYFTTILENCQNLSEMVTSFLALLELIKVQEISVEQEDNFQDIHMRRGQLWTT